MAETGASPAPRSQPPDRRERPLRRDRRPASSAGSWPASPPTRLGRPACPGPVPGRGRRHRRAPARRLRGRLAADPGRAVRRPRRARPDPAERLAARSAAARPLVSARSSGRSSSPSPARRCSGRSRGATADAPRRTGRWRRAPERAPSDQSAPAAALTPASRLRDLYRGGFGVALVVGAALLFLSQIDALGAARDAAFTAIVRGVRPRADPRAVHLAARAQPRRRAGRADPLAGAGRDGRAPARLGPADADPDAEARRRPARGGGARAAPGARAAGLARRRRAARPSEDGSPRPCGPPPRRSRTTTASRSRSSRSATRRSTSAAAARGRRRPRGADQRRQVRRRGRADLGLRGGRAGRDRGVRARPRPGLRSRAGRPRTAAACASRSSGGWSAHGGTATIGSRARRPGPRSCICGSTGNGRMSDRCRRSSSSTTTRCSAAGVRAELEGLVEVARPRPARSRRRSG